MCYIVFVCMVMARSHRYKQLFNQAIHFEKFIDQSDNGKEMKNKEYPM